MARYPKKEVQGAFGTCYVEMTPDEYYLELARYENSIGEYERSSLRRKREYGSYLRRWFSDQPCDGTADFDERFERHLLPMSCNVYLFG